MRLAIKAAVVVAMVVAILIPLSMVRDTIRERAAYRQQAVDEVTRSFAGEQSLAGPVLVVPYRERIEAEERDAQGVLRTRMREVDKQWLFFPKTLAVQGRLAPSERARGLHTVRVYEWQGRLDAGFDVTLPPADPQRPRSIGQAWINLGIGDVRGLVGAPGMRIGQVTVPVLQGQRGRTGGGVHAMLPQPIDAGGRTTFALRLGFALRGTEALAVVPLADANRIVLDSAWPHPQFNGDFLPRTHRVGADGFHAEWDVSSLASNAQVQYRAGAEAATPAQRPGTASSSALDRIGVSLVEPVNLYSKLDRASKYGVLFVLLTFTGFLLFETVRALPIHPIQYLLVGCALAIFFLLLLGLSEHVGFGQAYLLASVACLGLLAHYVGHVLRSPLRGVGFAAMLGVLYAALYGLLLSEDNALVLGSGLLFAILAAVMVATRKVDWYRVGARGAA